MTPPARARSRATHKETLTGLLQDYSEAVWSCGESPDSTEAVQRAGACALRLADFYKKRRDWEPWAAIAMDHADQYQFLINLAKTQEPKLHVV